MTTAPRIIASLAPLTTLLLACGPEPDTITYGIQAMSFANSQWSAPVNLGPIINSSALEMNATTSPDGLSLYFTSNRGGGLGNNDIWVSHRECDGCPWQTPANLGAPINSSGNDAGPSISIDGHLLFFQSNREPDAGAGDIYIARRADPNDDFAWGEPVRLGPEVNTAGFDAGAEYLQSAEDGAANLYFGRQPVGGVFDIYMVAVTRTGEIRGPAVPVAELNSTFSETGPTLRTDGREVVFFSTRPPGAANLNEFFVATRRSVHDPWSVPQHIPVLGSPGNDRHPSLSSDGRTLIFASTRDGGFGLDDLWMSTRTVNGH